MTYINKFSYADGPALDAFGRLRVGSPYTLFESKLLGLTDAPLLWHEILESGAGITASTPTAAQPFIDFTSTLNTAGVFTRQTRRRFRYLAGKSQLVTITGVLDLSGGGTGVVRRIGYFDDDNGLFFEDNAGTIRVVVRTNNTGSPVDSATAQSSWNIDPFDGTGPSGVTVDWSQSQIFLIDFQWLAVGRVRFGLVIGGALYYAHEFSHTNSSSIPYMSTPNLPVRYQMVTTSSSPASTMRCICSSVVSEGGAEPIQSRFSGYTATHVDADSVGTTYAVVGIRLKSTHLGTTIDPATISLLSTTNDNYIWSLRVNPTVAGTFTYSSVSSDSSAEIAYGATANTVTSGHVIDSGFGAGSLVERVAGAEFVEKLGSLIDGTPDELVLCTEPLSINMDVYGKISWLEGN